MKKVNKIKSIPALLPDINIDTDAIIPKQFLKTIERAGLGRNLFYDQRYLKDYIENKNFILNINPWKKTKILVTGENFGCGSSREHAPWALLDFGIECIIATSFADIFFNNSIKNGLFPLKVEKKFINNIQKLAAEKNIFEINLTQQNIVINDLIIKFDIDKDIKFRLINGYDDIGLALKYDKTIKEYEKKDAKQNSWKII
tara:strand:+ start:1160 stop:1762 length:603 start_codon:yes stop_codon:yes gene_type:complete